MTKTDKEHLKMLSPTEVEALYGLPHFTRSESKNSETVSFGGLYNKYPLETTLKSQDGAQSTSCIFGTSEDGKNAPA